MTTRMQNDTFVWVMKSFWDIYCPFLTSLPNYFCQLPAVWGYFIWNCCMFVKILFHFCSPYIQAMVHPWTWPRQHCLKVKLVMSEPLSLAESRRVWTSLQSLAFQRGHQWRAAAPLTEGEAAQLAGNVKSAKEIALQDSPRRWIDHISMCKWGKMACTPHACWKCTKSNQICGWAGATNITQALFFLSECLHLNPAYDKTFIF